MVVITERSNVFEEIETTLIFTIGKKKYQPHMNSRIPNASNQTPLHLFPLGAGCLIFIIVAKLFYLLTRILYGGQRVPAKNVPIWWEHKPNAITEVCVRSLPCYFRDNTHLRCRTDQRSGWCTQGETYT